MTHDRRAALARLVPASRAIFRIDARARRDLRFAAHAAARMPQLTHPYLHTVGWRFQAQAGDEVRVVDVRRGGDGWVITAVYD